MYCGIAITKYPVVCDIIFQHNIFPRPSPGALPPSQCLWTSLFYLPNSLQTGCPENLCISLASPGYPQRPSVQMRPLVCSGSAEPSSANAALQEEQHSCEGPAKVRHPFLQHINAFNICLGTHQERQARELPGNDPQKFPRHSLFRLNFFFTSLIYSRLDWCNLLIPPGGSVVLGTCGAADILLSHKSSWPVACILLVNPEWSVADVGNEPPQ